VATGVAARRGVSSSVGDVMAVGVKVEVGDGATDKGVRATGAGGPKGEQPSPMIATISGTEGRIDDPFLIDKRFIGNK
jgi:hypothetical protein